MPSKLSSLVAISAALCLPFMAIAQTSSPTPTPPAAVAPATTQPSIYIDAQDGFQSALAAAFIKKKVPASIVTDNKNAMYTLKSAEVYARAESTGSKVARCLLAYCAGIEGTASVSVQLIRNSDTAIVWAYQVRKANSGPVGIQSLSEAIAKHLRNDYLDKQK